MWGCKNQEKDEPIVTVNSHNIILAFDTSNRISYPSYQKHFEDTVLVNVIADHFDDILKIQGRKTEQKDILRADFINTSLLSQTNINTTDFIVDFGRFENQSDRIEYQKKGGLKNDIAKFKKAVGTVYKTARGKGAGCDIYSYMDGLSVGQKLKDTTSQEITDEITATVTEKRGMKNTLVLFTDGYIEIGAADKSNLKGYLLQESDIDIIRKAYLKQGSSDIEDFIATNKQFQINKTRNNLKGLNVLVVETFDRSVKNDNATEHPSDFEIYSAVWTKWLKDSGAGQVKIMRAATSKEDFFQGVKKFIESGL